MRDYYQILGLSREASQDEIKRAYRRLAHKYHPDKGGDGEKFKEISEAYQILGNPEKKDQYDRFGQVFEGAGTQGGFDPGVFWSNIRGEDFDLGMDLGDIFEDFLGFTRTGRRRKDINQGKNIEIELEIDLKDVLKGVKRNINLGKKIACQRCQGSGAEPGSRIKECFSCRGTGEVQQMKKTLLGTITRYVLCPECKGQGKIPENPCNVCRGEGRIEDYQDIEVYIPSGVDTGQIMKIDGKGEAGRRKARSGDLYVKILIKPHPVFERKGDDLYLALPVSFSGATLGDEVEVPTLEGKKILLKVLSGTESGKVFRISGKGIPHFSGFGRGNMYIELVIKTPKKLTKKQKELLEKLKEQGL